jgi:hypothetical protein
MEELYETGIFKIIYIAKLCPCAESYVVKTLVTF